MDWLILKTFLTLVFIVGLMVVLLFAVRKYFYTKPHLLNDNMKVLMTMNLQPKKAIYLVKIFSRVMLVGVSDNAMTSLGEITDAELLQKIESSGDVHKGKGFSEILKGFTQR